MPDFDDIFAEVAAEDGGEPEVETTSAPDPFEDTLDTELDTETDDSTTDDSVETDVEDDGDDDSPEVFDWMSDRDRLVTIIVDGEPQTMTLGEAMSGSMRQADYTRKTQELSTIRKDAEWAAQIRDYLEADPRAVIEAMAQQYGVKLALEAEVDPFEDLDEDIRPWAQKVQQLESMVERLSQVQETVSQERVVQEVRADIERLTAKYGEFDVQAVARKALEIQAPLEAAYAVWRLEQNATEAATKAAEEAAAKAKAARIAAKAAAAGRVAKGNGVRGTTVPNTDAVSSFEEMFNLVSTEMG